MLEGRDAAFKPLYALYVQYHLDGIGTGARAVRVGRVDQQSANINFRGCGFGMRRSYARYQRTRDSGWMLW